MAINSVNSTNLLRQYIKQEPVQTKPVKTSYENTPAPKTASRDELILKQKRVMELQKQEIERLNRQKADTSNRGGKTVFGILSVIAAIILLTKGFEAYNLKMANKLGEQMRNIKVKITQSDMLDDADDLLKNLKPKKTKKYSVSAIFGSHGKVIGKVKKDNKTGRILNRLEYYEGTTKPMTLEDYNYDTNRRLCSWFREDGSKMWEEVFELSSDKKLKTIFYKEDGITIDRVKRGV